EFGYTFPNYEPAALARCVCASQGWALAQVRFYTGVPEAADNPFWSQFWSAKLLGLSQVGVWTYSHPIRHRVRAVPLNGGLTIHPPGGAAHPPGTRLFLGDGSELPEGTELRVRVADDVTRVLVRIAVDIVRLAQTGDYEVILIFSQDQDLSEAAS